MGGDSVGLWMWVVLKTTFAKEGDGTGIEAEVYDNEEAAKDAAEVYSTRAVATEVLSYSPLYRVLISATVFDDETRRTEFSERKVALDECKRSEHGGEVPLDYGERAGEYRSYIFKFAGESDFHARRVVESLAEAKRQRAREAQEEERKRKEAGK
jgi:hypothetical protein